MCAGNQQKVSELKELFVLLPQCHIERLPSVESPPTLNISLCCKQFHSPSIFWLAFPKN